MNSEDSSARWNGIAWDLTPFCYSQGICLRQRCSTAGPPCAFSLPSLWLRVVKPSSGGEDGFEQQTSLHFLNSVKIASVDICGGPYYISFHDRCGCPSWLKTARSTSDTLLPTSKTSIRTTWTSPISGLISLSCYGARYSPNIISTQCYQSRQGQL